MVLCTKVTNQITLTDPVTLRSTSMDSAIYYRSPFLAASSSKQLVKYVVLDIEPVRGYQNQVCGRNEWVVCWSGSPLSLYPTRLRGPTMYVSREKQPRRERRGGSELQ